MSAPVRRLNGGASIDALGNGAGDEVAEQEVNARSVFVVHGRNEPLRKSMFDFLRSINLSLMEWSHAVELTGEGSPYIGQVLDAALDNAAAIVVLMTPDEIAYLQPQYGHGDNDPETKPAAQARPNVLFEAGMALGRDAKRTLLVEVGDVRPFSDVAGRHAIRLTNDSAKRQELANRLKKAGCDVDLRGADWHSTGDFTPPPPPGDGLPLGRRLPSNANVRKAIDFDVKYFNKGGNKIDKLQIINRGTETAFDVEVVIPTDASLKLQGFQTIKKIPGLGRSVTIGVMGMGRMFGGGDMEDTFDVTATGRTEAGEIISQDVFVDTNG
ncbi:TIR domain-containing protein [Microbacterium proteolyticum]|uniref:TIR domain-containing protein n=1 Tax=Microbacterium proteolyticum TaxID=1572644 RepID=UPI001FADFEC9|nr:TIR domain-containing protein [Microbacterium proteolyticum]MCI9857233.1 nucleotide-binding protein [Microbacterium proteolyticum]